MTYYRGRSGGGATAGSVGIGCLGVLVAATALFLIALAVAPYYTTQFWWVIRESLFIWIPLIIVAVLGIIALVTFDDSPSTGVGFGLLAAAGAIGVFFFWGAHSYLEHKAYASSAEVTNDPVPPLSVRNPFNVAEKQAPADLGSTVGDIQTTMYLPDQRRFTTLIARKGFVRGYTTLLVQDIGDTGRNAHELCSFSPAANRSFGGMWSSSLGRLINKTQRFVNWDHDDVYGYCDHGHPVVVTPLKEQVGWLVVTERPAGLAVYHGDTGVLDIVTDPAQIAAIPGPTYPLSLAAQQRDALKAYGGGWWDYVQNRLGWEPPSDESDINSQNIQDFVLSTDQGHPEYVTLLTPRGGAQGISVITTVPARQTQTGQLVTLVAHRTNWLSPAAIEQRIKANFGPVFTAQPGATISELAPTSETDWVATIGLPQNMLYRVKGRGDLSTDLCLYGLDNTQIHCGQMTNIGGYGPGVAIGQTAPGVPGVVPAPANSDLRGLSKPQLIDLIQRATAELGSRP